METLAEFVKCLQLIKVYPDPLPYKCIIILGLRGRSLSQHRYRGMEDGGSNYLISPQQFTE